MLLIVVKRSLKLISKLKKFQNCIKFNEKGCHWNGKLILKAYLLTPEDITYINYFHKKLLNVSFFSISKKNTFISGNICEFAQFVNNITHSEKLRKNSPHTQNAPYVWLLFWSKNSRQTTYHSYKHITNSQPTFPEAYFSVNIRQLLEDEKMMKKILFSQNFTEKNPCKSFFFNKIGTKTGVFLRILAIFSKHLFYKQPVN